MRELSMFTSDGQELNHISITPVIPHVTSTTTPYAAFDTNSSTFSINRKDNRTVINKILEMLKGIFPDNGNITIDENESPESILEKIHNMTPADMAIAAKAHPELFTLVNPCANIELQEPSKEAIELQRKMDDGLYMKNLKDTLAAMTREIMNDGSLEIVDETQFVADLGMEYQQAVTLMTAIEHEFDIEVDESEIDERFTLLDGANYIFRKLYQSKDKANA